MRGLATTANAGGVHNLEIAANAGDLDAMLRGMGRGLLVTELMGQGVNNITGDYSRGAAGFWVEDGAISHAVDGITIAGNLKTMFRDIEAVGSDVDPRSHIHTGSIRSEEHTSELQSLMRISYAVFCLKKKKNKAKEHQQTINTRKTT